VITYSGAAAGVEVIATSGNGVYALRELETGASGPVSAEAVRTLLAALIAR
jgi:hypothetical protein